MADKWTVTAADKNTITVVANIDTTDYETIIGLSSLDTSTSQKLQTSLRTFIIGYRDRLLASITPIAIVDTVVGYTEDF